MHFSLTTKLINLIFLHAFLKPIDSQQVNNNRDLFDIYNPINSFDISTKSNLLGSFQLSNRYDCFVKCSSLDGCILLSVKNNLCRIYNKINTSDFVSYIGDPCLFKKKFEDYSLINSYLSYYWAFNGDGVERIKGANTFNGVGFSYVADRLNKPSSAIYVSNGFIQMPSKFYINSDFTISAWYFPKSYVAGTGNRRLCQFNTADGQDVVLVDIFASINFAILNTGVQRTISATANSPGKWYHLAVTLEGTLGKIYVNGQLKTQGALFTVRNIIQTNALMFAHVPSAQPTDSIIDDFKIFNRSLTQSEIIKVMNSYF